MDSMWLMWATAGLMLALATGCTTLFFFGARAVWRRDLDLGLRLWGSPRGPAWRLRGWAAALGGGLLAVGSGYYALLGWYGVYWAFALAQHVG